MPQAATKAKRAASYARVSTEAQGKDDKNGYLRQANETTAYATKNNFELIAEYRDTISGTTTTREGFERLKAEIDRYDAVIISSVDRLARNMAGAFRLLSELLELGVELHSADMGVIDIKDDADIMNFTMRAMSAHLQHSSIRKNTLAGRLAMPERGLNPSGVRNYGYLSAKGKGYPHPEHAQVVKRIYELAASGVSYRAITETLNYEGVPPSTPERTEKFIEDGEQKKRVITTEWHPSTVSHLVKNPVYHQGYTTWRRHRIPLEPLVSADLWQKAQKRVGAPPRYDWPLVGHLRCGYCGRRMSARRTPSRGHYVELYKCQNPVRPRCLFGLARSKTEARVEAAVRELFTNPGAVQRLMRDDAPDPKIAEELAEIKAKYDEAFHTWDAGIITPDELGRVRRRLENRRIELTSSVVPEAEPIDLDVAVLADATMAEILAVLPIMATLTRDSVTLSVE